MKLKDIVWVEDGWTLIQDADPEKHTLEISCYAENGTVTEVRKRHNDGEEEKLKGMLSPEYSLPMALKDFKTAIVKKKLTLK